MVAVVMKEESKSYLLLAPIVMAGFGGFFSTMFYYMGDPNWWIPFLAAGIAIVWWFIVMAIIRWVGGPFEW